MSGYTIIDELNPKIIEKYFAASDNNDHKECDRIVAKIHAAFPHVSTLDIIDELETTLDDNR